MSKQSKIYIKNVSIEGATSVEGDFHYYDGIIQTQSLNTRYAFRASMETLRSIANQAKAGVHIYPGHRYFNQPLGKSVSGRLYGKKAYSSFFVQGGVADTNSDDHIKRLDSGIIDELSTGFMLTDQSRLKCDLCSGVFEQKFSWFNAYFEDAEGHILGQKIKSGENKGKRVTAELLGPVNLQEYSLVAVGADPGAEVLKKIKTNLQNGIFDEGILEYFSESFNVSFDNLQNSLESFANSQPNRTIIDMGGKTMSVELLTQENNRLSTENTELTNQVATLEEQVEGMHSAEDYESLQSEMESTVATLTSERDEAKTKVQENEVMANEGVIALEHARKEYKEAFKSACGNSPPTEEELENLDKSLKKQTSFSEIQSGIERLRKDAREKRSGGRKSKVQSSQKPAEAPKPEGYGWGGV